MRGMVISSGRAFAKASESDLQGFIRHAVVGVLYEL
jgi:hypothetical protein